MKIILGIALFALSIQFSAAETGKSPQGPTTYGQQTYPSSGSTKNRRNVMGGRASSASKASDMSSPSERSQKNPQRQETQEDRPIKKGPYNENEKFQYLEN